MNVRRDHVISSKFPFVFQRLSPIITRAPVRGKHFLNIQGKSPGSGEGELWLWLFCGRFVHKKFVAVALSFLFCCLFPKLGEALKQLRNFLLLAGLT
jgi:hypothetical protein